MSVTGQSTDLVQKLADAFAPVPPQKLGVAVSGGGDSVALLCLLNDWRTAGGPALEAVTVDHGLRPDSAQEAVGVADLCAHLDVPHTTLKWTGWNGKGNLPDQARRARYQLMSDWAEARGIMVVALGHTLDDVAETFMMRLARGSGLDGLSAMADTVISVGSRSMFYRPMLDWTRTELRDELNRRGQVWTDDPSNEDDRFERVRIRKALTHLNTLGISSAGIAETANKLRTVREDFSQYVSEAAKQAIQFDAGDLLIPLPDGDCCEESRNEAEWISDREETFRRVLQAGVMWISGAEYPPRSKTLGPEIVWAQTDTTLGGCRVLFRKEAIRMTREWKAVADLRVPVEQIWDGRWKLTGPTQPGYEIAALGEDALGLCPNRKNTGRPAASLIASPAVWQGDTLIAAPLAGLGNGWRARLLRGSERLFALLAG